MKKIIVFLILLFVLYKEGYSQTVDYPFRDKNLPISERLTDLINRMTLEEKIALLSGYQDFYFHPCVRLGIPAFKMADGPLGIASWGLLGRATAFPSTLSVAASWNRELVYELAKVYAEEWRARGIHFILAPGANIYRASKSARNFEYWGEDPYLTSSLIVPFIKGVQEGGVAATVKHYIGNDQEFDRYRVSTEMDERTLREIYLPPFKAAVEEAGVKAVMTGYNPVNGVYMTQNSFLINLLKKELGFKGLLMSDWACTYSALEAATSGLDMEMGSHKCLIWEQLKPLIDNGKLSKELINEKVRRIYGVCMEMGFFDRPQRMDSIPTYNERANHMALQVAEEGIILLKNQNGLLPLNPDNIHSIALIGPTANPSFITDRVYSNNQIVYGGGGSSKVNPWYVVSDLEGIKKAFPNTLIYYCEGISNQLCSDLFKSSVFYLPSGERGVQEEYIERDGMNEIILHHDYVKQINYQWNSKYRDKEVFSSTSCVRWTGAIHIEQNDSLLFFVHAQGGYRLWIDGKLVADAWTSPSFRYDHLSVKGHVGQFMKVVLEYNNNQSNPAEIRMGYCYKHTIDFREALSIARKADVVIFCGGYDGSLELEGKDREFDLPYGQALLIDELTRINKPIIVVMHGGGGMNMTEWEPKVPVILHALYAGQEGGYALGELLSGQKNPSAKLPFSIEKTFSDSPAYGNYDETRNERKVYYNEGIFVGYRYFDYYNKTPLYPFGYGLSYSHFTYSNLVVKKNVIQEPDQFQISVSFSITNDSSIDGYEIAELYVHAIKSKVIRPIKELKGYRKVYLTAGETKEVSIVLDANAFKYFNTKEKKWVLEKGNFELLVGKSSRDIVLHQMIKL